MKYSQRHPPHNSWNKTHSCATQHRAFTLIDLSVTLALVACVAAISLPVLLNFQHFYVASQARILQTTCWALQQQALAENKEFTLEFNEAANSYAMAKQNNKLAPKVKFGVLPGLSGPPSNQSHKLINPITFEYKKIIFYPTGRISPGSVYLIDDNLQTLYAITVPVSSVSYIRLYRYYKTHWQLCT